MDMAGGWVVAVYPASVSRQELQELSLLAARLQSQTGIRARAAMTRLADWPTPLPAVLVKRSSGTKFTDAMAKLKKWTNPKFPIAIQAMDVELLSCRCGAMRPSVAAIEFLHGLGALDERKFKASVTSWLKRCPLVELVERCPTPPYQLVLAEVQTALTTVGAYASASALRIQCTPETRACKHKG